VLETLSRVTLEQMAQSTMHTVPLATIKRRPARTTTTA